MTNDIQPLPPEVEALALRALETRVGAALKGVKTESWAYDYEDGDKRVFRSPVDDLRLGSVYRSDPEPRWVINDRKALEDHLREFAGNLVPVITGDEAEVMGVLLDHAPHLIGEELDQSAVQAALEQSKATGEAAAPGIARVKPGGTLTIRPDENAALAIEGLVKAGLLSWDGRRALPASERREAS